MTVAASFIRRATPDDVEFGIGLVRELYPNRDITKMRGWLTWVLNNPDYCTLIGINSVGCASVYWKYGTDMRARLQFLGANTKPGYVFEPLRIVRMLMDWSKSKGAKGEFRLDADTGVNFAPFAKRLGGTHKTAEYWDIPYPADGELNGR